MCSEDEGTDEEEENGEDEDGEDYEQDDDEGEELDDSSLQVTGSAISPVKGLEKVIYMYFHMFFSVFYTRKPVVSLYYTQRLHFYHG